MIASLQDAVARNGGQDLSLMHKVTAAHAAGDQMSSVSSITYVGAVVVEGPGNPTVSSPAVVNILLP
jgi:hypothetical protein